jgi:N-acyl-phosphatidylethanolamine-hydrolysing phospholipase D
MMEPQHVSPDEAVQIHIDTRSKKSIGIHWGTWALAKEYYLEPRDKLPIARENSKLNPESFIVVKHGEIFDLPENN